MRAMALNQMCCQIAAIHAPSPEPISSSPKLPHLVPDGRMHSRVGNFRWNAASQSLISKASRTIIVFEIVLGLRSHATKRFPPVLVMFVRFGTQRREKKPTCNLWCICENIYRNTLMHGTSMKQGSARLPLDGGSLQGIEAAR